MHKTQVLFVLVFLFTLIFPGRALADQETFKGIVESVRETKEVSSQNNTTFYSQKLDVKIVPSPGEEKIIEINKTPGPEKYSEGDKVYVAHTENSQYYVTERIRTDSIAFLFVIFVAIVALVSRGAGLASLLGMGYSFLVIFNFLLPQLYRGGNTIIFTLLTVLLIAPVTFVLSHGFNKKTLVAISATFISLTVTSLLALLFINKTHLTGFGSEEAYFLQLAQSTINIKGILLAGIIIGTLGILDDATVTQSAIVAQLKGAYRNISASQVFAKAMSVGHDHIASTVNTLILVYTGASLPLLLLFINSNKSFTEVLNNEIIAEEVVTMLVSSIGLILSIPVTTFLASHFLTKDDAGESHSHHHHH